jgi:hypothetical protein
MRTRAIYLCALLVLVLNDHILKYAWPSWFTGKLSDFAGVFALALLLGSFTERALGCSLAAALFCYWKSPLSQPLIDSLPWSSSRVVDWTDLAALAMLLPAYRLLAHHPPRGRFRLALAALSFIAFMATSVTHTTIDVAPSDPYATVASTESRDAVLKNFRACGFEPNSFPNGFQLNMTPVVEGKPREMFVYVRVAANGSVTIYSLQVFGEEPVNEVEATKAAHRDLAACIAAHSLAPRLGR